MSDPHPDPLLPAAGHPSTRAWLRRWLGAGTALTLLGAALLGLAAQHWTAVDTRCQSFVDAGDTTLATITDTHSARFGDTITVRVEFTDRPPDVVRVTDAALYAVGDEVVLAYDPQQPDTLFEATCDYEDTRLSVWAGGGALLALGLGLPLLVLTSLLARRLRREPWREVVTSVESSTSWWSAVPGYTVTVDGVPVRIAGGMWVMQGPVFEADAEVTLWVAGPVTGRSIPVAPRGGGSVFRGVVRHGA